MKFWRGNRVDAEFDRPIDQVAVQFWNSPEGSSQLCGSTWPLERSLRAFLTDPQGFNAVWDDEDEFGRLFERVRTAWPKAITAEINTKSAPTFTYTE
jgi:hypothetical protein